MPSEKSAKTKARIIAAATVVFSRDGYTQASLNEIIKKAKLTTGAVYYHYRDKKTLFQAVAEHLEQEILDRVMAVSSIKQTPWDNFENSILGTIEICARPDIQRIVFTEAPGIIGLREWRKIEKKYAFGLLSQTIADLNQAGLIKSDDTDITAQILLGALMEAAHSVALAKNQKKAIKSAKSTLKVMIQSLRK